MMDFRLFVCQPNRELTSCLTFEDKLMFRLMKGKLWLARKAYRFFQHSKAVRLIVFNRVTGEKVQLDYRLGSEFLSLYDRSSPLSGLKREVTTAFGNFYVEPAIFNELKKAAAIEADHQTRAKHLFKVMTEDEKEDFARLHAALVANHPFLFDDTLKNGAGLSEEALLLSYFEWKKGLSSKPEDMKEAEEVLGDGKKPLAELPPQALGRLPW